MSKEENACNFGNCQHYYTCKDRQGKCERYKPCETYMDKYDNDRELWCDLHGEYYNE